MKIGRILAAIVLVAFSVLAHAQGWPCGVRSVTEQKPVYPAIAKAAHVSGDVTLAATFDLDGSVRDVRAVEGPEMLKKAAKEFVRTWHANQTRGQEAASSRCITQ